MINISYFIFLLLSFWKLHFCPLQCFWLLVSLFFSLLKVLLDWYWNSAVFQFLSNTFYIFIPLCYFLREFHDLIFLLTNLLFSDNHSAKSANLLRFYISHFYISSFYYLQCCFLFALKIPHLFMSKCFLIYGIFIHLVWVLGFVKFITLLSFC